MVRVGSRIGQQSRWCHPMTCRRRGLGLACLMTSSGDVRWHQQEFFGVWKPRWRVWCRIRTRFSGEVDQGTTRPSSGRVWPRSELRAKNLRQRVWEFQELLFAHGGACRGSWRLGSWVSVTICLGSRLSYWFHQAKAWCAQIW